MMWQPYLVGAGLGSVYERRVDVVSRVGVHVGIFLSLGLDAVPLWILDLPVKLRLVLAARGIMGRMEHALPRSRTLRVQFAFPRPPATPGQTLVVNRSVLAANPGVVQNRIEFRSGSAGLGVPRGSVRNLGKISRQVETSPATGGLARRR